VEAVCSTCGERNSPEAQFCTLCGAYLGWQEGAGPRPDTPDGPSPVTEDPDDTVIRPLDLSSSAGAVLDERLSFEAVIDVVEATLPIDGTAVPVTVNLVNTSTVVESYVVEALDVPPWLEVHPGQTELLPTTSGTAVAHLRIASSRLVAAQQASVVLRVQSTTQRSEYRDLPLALTVPVVTGPLEVRAEPRMLRARDNAPAACRVVVSNTRSNRWAQVRLTTTDPEQVVRATWEARKLQVPPGGEAATNLQLDAPPPEPGGEVSRTITISAAEGDLQTETTVTLEQSASRAAIDLIALRLNPSVLRLGGRHRGHLAAVVDNRSGGAPVRVVLSGHDPEKSLDFAISPATLDVPPGQERSATVTITAPGTPPGKEVTRPLTIVASDGRADTRVDGSVIQLASSRRGIARLVFTVLGALTMILGALLPFADGLDDKSAVQLTPAQIATQHGSDFFDRHSAAGFENVVSLGLLLILLAGLVLLGLTGTTGKMTRRAALLGILVVLASYIGATVANDATGPGSGVVLALVGCVLAYVGGLLARR
jgi:hypothetical protein